jgi:aryl-alcohol dehydrogenase-like predicted oxidoreductase
MQTRTLGNTGLQTTPLGYGSAQLGMLHTPREEASRMLNGVLDAGVRLIDTAECYGISEELIGHAIAHRRGEFTLVTKCGHHTEDGEAEEWTPELIRSSAERSLRRLRTDHVDLIYLHTCTRRELENDAMIEAFQKLKRDGLTRYIGYSGDNEDALFAIDMGIFESLETTLNFLDQRGLEQWIPRAAAAGMGVMIKRALANSPWRGLQAQDPFFHSYVKPYVDRFAQMNFQPRDVGFDGDWDELALRFTAYAPGVSLTLSGGRNLDHIRRNIAHIEQGPLPDEVIEGLRRIYAERADPSWVTQS